MQNDIHQATISRRNTWQREEILAILNGASTPVSAEHIHDTLRNGSKRISLSTVYRTLQALELKHLVHRVSSNDRRRTLYRLHGHNCSTHVMTCRKCGTGYDLSDCPLKDMSGAIESGSFLVECHHLEIRGICGKCRENVVL